MFSVTLVLEVLMLERTYGNWITASTSCLVLLVEYLVRVHLMFVLCHFYSFALADMIKRRNLRTRNIKILILDEADEMLNKGVIIFLCEF